MANNVVSSETEIGTDKSWNDFWRAAPEILWSHTRRLFAKFLARVRKPALPGNSTGFVEVDATSVCTQLDVEERAISDAERDEPRTSEDSPSGTQLEIINHFRSLRRRGARNIAALNKRTRTFRNRIDFPADLESLRSIETRAENKIVRLNANLLSKLELLNEREAQQQQHYEIFREENKLDRVAENPISTLFLLAFIAALVGVGAVAISRLSGTGPDGIALLQPASAIGISFVVVIIPLMLGAAVFPLVNHLSDLKQIFGLAGGIAAAAVIGSAAMLAARFVSAAAIDPSVTWPSIMDAWLQAPFEIAFDGSSWMVLGIVCLLGLLAFLVGYRSDDPYPGYGSVQRAYYRARQERETLANSVREQIDKVVDDADMQVAKLLSGLKARVKRYESMAEEARSAPAAFSGYIDVLEDTCRIVIDRYRRANESARSTDAPSYFYESDSLIGGEDAMTTSHDDAAHPLAEVLKDMADFDTQIGRSRRRLKDLNWRAAELLEISSLSGNDRSEGESRIAPA
jgi:hypothetical protein